MYVTILLGNIYILRSTIYFILLSSSTRRRFYPQRPSGQAVVTGAVPSPPRYVPSFMFYKMKSAGGASISFWAAVRDHLGHLHLSLIHI